MDHAGCFYIWPILKKIEGPYSRDMVEPDTGARFTPQRDMLVVAPPDYPQLAEGLEIGVFYDAVPGPSGSHGHMHDIDCLDYYFEWCQRLASLVTNGKKLKERLKRMVDWSNALSELVEITKNIPKPTGGDRSGSCSVMVFEA
ncbi:hypothetical protein [Caballeronia sp. S22]|uniref:hypothetical protein n=1 Tax=Caballeronia sp. S22 TaxID=3137182 RepID=UPI0035313643